jgi:hypothetical protein
VDVHLVTFGSICPAPDGVYRVYGPDSIAYPVGALDGTGVVGGRLVRCGTAEFQMWSHTGYETDEDDYRDVLALHERFGLPLPAEYLHWTESR